MNMKSFFLAATILMGTASVAQAAGVSLGGPGFFNGSGNPDGGFTTTTGNNAFIAQRWKERQEPGIIDPAADGIYYLQPGMQVTSPTYGRNNSEFSISCYPGPCASGELFSLVSNAWFTLTDITTGLSNSVNILTNFGDGQTYDLQTNSEGTILDLNFDIFQNSENPKFSSYPMFIGGPLGFNFDPFANDLYLAQIDIYGGPGKTGGLLASNGIYGCVGTCDVSKIPEPLTLSAFGAGLAGIAAMRRRKQRKA
jgi:hypothetical protein